MNESRKSSLAFFMPKEIEGLSTLFRTIIATVVAARKKEAKISIQDSITALHRQLDTAQKKIDSLEKQINILAPPLPCDLTNYDLTKRELEITRLLIMTEGTTKSFVEALGIQKSTVQQHLQNIFTKTGADNRYHLIEMCRNNFS
ncbi:MAG: helix-turn-helix transcriptional regulator [Spirochaetales bacterium]|nr:helix-turn-helix transcriptional regulator [Spirochaetales bacterium]